MSQNFKIGLWSSLYLSTMVALAGCTNKTEDDPSAGLIKGLPSSTVILKFEGGEIKASDVENEVDPKLEGLRAEILNLYQKKAETLLNQRLLEAAINKKGVKTVEELLGPSEITDLQVQNYIKANKIAPEQRNQVKTFLQDQMTQMKKQELIRQLNAQAKVQSVMGSARFDAGSLKDSPAKGESSAKVVIQEFCDFQNPLCGRARIAIEELRAKHGEKLKIAFRHLPVDSNPMSRPAALAAICAFKQSKFWEAHDALFNSQAALSTEKISTIVSAVVEDKSAFEKCLQSRDAKDSLDEDMTAAKSLDIQSTPTFLVNGARVSDLDALRSKVEQEFAKN